MAYVFGFPQEITGNIYSMRDWCWETVRDAGGTPSARCFSGDLDTSRVMHPRVVYADIETFSNNPRQTMTVSMLRGSNGEVPIEFRRLEKGLEKRTKELWWQCEAC